MYDSISRRSFAGFLASGAIAGCTIGGADEASAQSGESIPIELVSNEFTRPMALGSPPGQLSTLFVIDQAGRVHRLPRQGGESSVILDIRDRIVRNGNEMGLLGIAFHPNYADNGRLFLRYSAPPRPGTPNNFNHTFVLAEFTVEDGSINPASERTILEIPEPQGNHNAGAIEFGPDGFLYVAVGDGGAGGDQGTGHVSDWYDAVGGGNGQDVTENLLGSILRIDVDTTDGEKNYGIPADNPFADGTDGLPEHYAWGLRNPWRMSFWGDDLIVGDVGQNKYEEISLVEKGGNYGWNVWEGRHCFQAQSCPDTGPNGEPLVKPVVEYGRSGAISGFSVIGGYVYSGSVDSLSGKYVFGDYRAGDTLFVADPDRTADEWITSTRTTSTSFGQLFSLGVDGTGELYLLASNGIFRVGNEVASPETDETDEEATARISPAAEPSGETTTGTGPGFGLLAGLASIGVAGWIGRRLSHRHSKRRP